MKVVLQKQYRPISKEAEGDAYMVGETVDLPDDEAKSVIGNGIGISEASAKMDPNERAAVAYLTDLGYTVTAPKPILTSGVKING